jgi:hypothetical protein
MTILENLKNLFQFCIGAKMFMFNRTNVTISPIFHNHFNITNEEMLKSSYALSQEETSKQLKTIVDSTIEVLNLQDENQNKNSE